LANRTIAPPGDRETKCHDVPALLTRFRGHGAFGLVRSSAFSHPYPRALDPSHDVRRLGFPRRRFHVLDASMLEGGAVDLRRCGTGHRWFGVRPRGARTWCVAGGCRVGSTCVQLHEGPAGLERDARAFLRNGSGHGRSAQHAFRRGPSYPYQC